MTDTDFTWKRQPGGGYVARHGFWVYNVYRNDRAAKGHQWVLKAWPEGNPEAAQERTGLHTAQVAKKAAQGTHCFICGKTKTLGELKRKPGQSQLSYPTWVCRDEKLCHAERKWRRDRHEREQAPADYASALSEIVKLKSRVRQLEADALALHDKARELGTPEYELRAIEQQHGFGLPGIPVE